MKRIILNIGEIAVSREPAILETILGSCVAVCLWDEISHIGGLNHYLLPLEPVTTPRSTVYGATSIEAMIQQIIEIGADIDHLQAHIYGGGSVIAGLDDIFNIGMENVRIAREKLYGYGIPIICEHIRARHGIRIVFKTSTGGVKITPLGELSNRLSATETAAVHKQMRPCKSCIMCGSCDELLERKRQYKDRS